MKASRWLSSYIVKIHIIQGDFLKDKLDHVIPLFKSPKWLPINERVQSELLGGVKDLQFFNPHLPYWPYLILLSH